MDLVADFAGPLPVMVIAEMIGIPFEARPRFMRWSQAIVNLSTRLRGAHWRSSSFGSTRRPVRRCSNTSRALSRASDEPWEPRQALHVHGPSRLPIRFTPRT
jgi:cytochrome P450